MNISPLSFVQRAWNSFFGLRTKPKRTSPPKRRDDPEPPIPSPSPAPRPCPNPSPKRPGRCPLKPK